MPSKGQTYVDLGISAEPICPHILAAATVVYGPDLYSGFRETVSLSGFVQINKWPMKGFRHKVKEDGRAEFELELISRPDVGIKGFSYALNDRMQVLSHPDLPNTGCIAQIIPGQNFPGNFIINRFGILQSAGMSLVHNNVIRIEGIIDSIPPYKTPLTGPVHGVPPLDGSRPTHKQVNVVGGVNLPEAWCLANERLQPTEKVVAHFAGAPGVCISMLTNPNYIVQASASAEASIDFGDSVETVELDGDHRKAAGLELLYYEPDRHRLDEAIRVQLARLALCGRSEVLRDRFMLRVGFAQVSHGFMGVGDESEFEGVAFPAKLVIDAYLEVISPFGEGVTKQPVRMVGQLAKEFRGSTLSWEASQEPLRLTSYDGEVLAKLHKLVIQLGEATFGTAAYADDRIAV
jgi:hypothetical protein